MMSLLVATTLMVHVLYPTAVRRAAEWKIIAKEVQKANGVVPAKVVMVVDAVSNDLVTLVEEATSEATMEEDVSTPVEPMALMTGTLVVFVVLQDSVLIKGI